MIGKIKELYNKYREVISYLFFGGLTTLVSISTQFIADYVGAGTILATTISWVCAVTYAFFVNKIFVFQNKSDKKREWLSQAAAFYGARLTTYFMELGFMVLTVDVLGFNMHLMKIVAQVFIIIGNYLLSKFLIFKKK